MRPFVFGLACMAVAGCASVTAGLDFKPPAGWIATPSIFGHFQAWVKQSPNKQQDQMVMLIRGETTSTMDFKNLPQGASDIRDRKESPIVICGNQRAQYLTAIGTDQRKGTDVLEMISAPIGDQSYLAMYIRPKSQPVAPEAETAIRSLCIKR